jgi:predicted ATP-dependent endonuclease of OLD family
LFNQETLRIFFSKNVLFVEGMTEYLFFNNILRRELQEELKDVEIIPIFGKYHYTYFYELVKELNLNY